MAGQISVGSPPQGGCQSHGFPSGKPEEHRPTAARPHRSGRRTRRCVSMSASGHLFRERPAGRYLDAETGFLRLVPEADGQLIRRLDGLEADDLEIDPAKPRRPGDAEEVHQLAHAVEFHALPDRTGLRTQRPQIPDRR